VVVPVDVGAGDPVDLLVADLVALVSQVPFQRDSFRGRVDQLDHALTVLWFLVRQDPDVRADAGAEEYLRGQFHDAVDIVLLEQPAADVRRSASRVPVEQRGARQHDRGLAASLLDGGELRGDVLDEQHGPVADGGQSRAETSLEPVGCLLPHGLFLDLPFLAVGRVGQLVVERQPLELVVGKGVALHDVLRKVAHRVELVLSRAADVAQQQVGLADRPGHALAFLTVRDDGGG